MPDYDVAVVGGGPAGSVLAALLARAQTRVVVLERDHHPRFHVGESLTPSTNAVLDRIGFLPTMESAGFVHKRGACWTAPGSPPNRFMAITLAEFLPPGAQQDYTYNVERDEFDARLLEHARRSGADVLQGARVVQVLMQNGRARGVLASVDGRPREITAKIVVDASGRRCLLGTQLGLKERDSKYSQFSLYSWFRGLRAQPEGFEGYVFLHFLGLERAWAWEIPLRDGISSVGVVTHRRDFAVSPLGEDEFFMSLVRRSRSFDHAMKGADRVLPWAVEGDYSYRMRHACGAGWILIGDALRFVDPIFSSGVDVAMFSALFAFEAIRTVLEERDDEDTAFRRFERQVGPGIETWYTLTDLFYTVQHLFTRYAAADRFREDIVRILQGNPYLEETRERAERLTSRMRSSYERIAQDNENLLRPDVLARNLLR